jgi:predicted DNA-binding transcriptional regulator AlpA
MEYEFTLKFQIAKKETDFEQLIEALGNAGCTDALVGMDATGRLSLEFCREAESANQAVESAMTDAMSAIPTAIFVEIGPDFISLTDLARIIKTSRQNIRKIMLNNEDFPLPVHDGNAASVWHLAPVLKWFSKTKQKQIKKEIFEVALKAMQINIEKQKESVETEFSLSSFC